MKEQQPPKFYTTSVSIKNRRIDWIIPRHEDLVVEVCLTSSGDTRCFTQGQIEEIIMNKLSIVEPID